MPYIAELRFIASVLFLRNFFFCVCMRCLLKEELWEKNALMIRSSLLDHDPVRHAWSQPSLKLIITQRWDERFPYSQSCAICIWPIISKILLSCFQVVSLFIAGFSSSLSTECNLWCEKLLFGKVCLISSALKNTLLNNAQPRSLQLSVAVPEFLRISQDCTLNKN